MADNTVQTGGEGNGASTALLAILVIAVVAFGIWFIMRGGVGAPAQQDTGGEILDIEFGRGGGNNEGGQSGGGQQPSY